MVTIAQNKKARHDYEVLDTIEAGIALQGTEVKSCRAHNVSLNDSYAKVIDNELWLINAHIAPYKEANRFNHEPRRDRKLLVHKREIRRLQQAIEAKGLTLIPLRVLFRRSKIKVELGLAKGKALHDKRETLKRKMHDREAQQAIKRY